VLPTVHSLVTSRAVQTWATSVGGGAFTLTSGALQVVAVHAGSNGVERVLRINSKTPKSRGDRLCLELARCWADVIVLTGAILHAEPSLDYAWWEPSVEVGRALEAWRGQLREGRAETPRLVVMTRGRGLPVEHPVLRNPRTVLCVPADAHVDPRLGHLPVQRLPGDDGREVLRACREQLGAERISMEAGPRISVPLFERPNLIDALLCSRYAGSVAPEMLVGEFVPREVLSRAGRYVSEPQRVRDESAQWSHIAWRRNT